METITEKEEYLEFMQNRRWGDSEREDNKILDKYLEIVERENLVEV